MSNRTFYDQHLRVVGQALEARRINVFELKTQGDQYVVRGKAEKDTSLFGKLRDWQARMAGRGPESAMTFIPPEIERLDKQGKSKRSKADRLPDFYSLSNTLRTVGSYLDSKGAQLLEIHKGSLNLALLYQTKEGHPNFEERPIASFYNFFLTLHGRRAKRAVAERG
ncbi:MAG: hypothetical protein ACREQ7_07550 [Candidatus Binatia bacterium]